MNWRSLLYVPANSERFLASAQSRGADALILDLEDLVPDERKEEARAMLTARLGDLANGPSDLLVRINGSLLEAARDLEAAVHAGVSALYVAKAESPAVLQWISQAIAALEGQRGLEVGQIGLVPLLETPAAVEGAFDIARAPRVCALTLGSEDYATACGMTPTPEHLLQARHRIVAAARSAGIASLGLLASVAHLDADNLAETVRASRDFGFSGATAVHPNAIAALNAGFAPSPEEIAWARQVLEILDAAAQSGRGAARLDGSMIDRPMRIRADAILRQVERRAE